MKKVAVIGANDQQNPLILKVKEKGFEAHVFAWQTGGEIGERTADVFYPISAGNQEAILSKCREIGVCAIVSIGSDIAARSAAYAANAMGLCSNSYDSVVRATNKILTRDTFARAGIPQPAYFAITDSIPESLRSLGYPLVVKPSDRSGGRGLRKVEDERQLYAAINEAREISFERRAIVEKYIEGQTYSCECISFGGRHRVIGYTKRSVLQIGMQLCENEHSQPAILPRSVMARMDELSKKALDALGLSVGASSVEFIEGPDGALSVVEATPSMYGDYIGTHLIPVSTGYDYLEMVLDAACGKEPDLTAKGTKERAAVRFWYSAADHEGLPEEPTGVRYGCRITRTPFKPYGGSAPLPVKEGTPFRKDGLPLCSEYAALWAALRELAPARLHLPYYIAPAMAHVLDELSVEPIWYHIGRDFLPQDLEETEDPVLLVNYFGGCETYIRRYASGHTGLIVDHSTSFFSEPIRKEGVYNIYSARKFFAVSDGAYLVAERLPELSLARDVSYKRARTLLQSLELGEEAAYKEHMANEQELAGVRKRMSLLTEKLLSAVDYQQEKTARAENYRALDARLRPFNQISISAGDAVPQFYPLLVDADIRSSLVAKKIYAPLMWRRFLSEEFEGTFEKLLSEKLILLPIDPRYTPEDMAYIAETVTALLT